jgi:hypothetical protein
MQKHFTEKKLRRHCRETLKLACGLAVMTRPNG